MDHPRANGSSGKGAMAVIVGLIISLAGYLLVPSGWYISDASPGEVYISSFFLLMGAGLALLGFRKIIG